MSVDVLFAHPLFLSQNEAEMELMSPYFPLGLLYLAAYVRDRGFSVAVFDGTFERDEGAFAAALEQHQPRVVGLSVVLPNRGAALGLARTAHTFGSTVVVGGPDPTQAPERYLDDPAIDIVVHHEGEETLVELLGALLTGQGEVADRPDLEGILGLAFCDSEGNVVINPPRPFIADLDTLPVPARDLIDTERYLDVWQEQNGYASLSIAVSRGCPYGCEWCQDAVNGPELRQRSPEDVAAEMKVLKDTFKIDRLRLVDDVDGLSREWLEAWAAAVKTQDAVLPFEALNDLQRQDIPLLDVRDSL